MFFFPKVKNVYILALSDFVLSDFKKHRCMCSIRLTNLYYYFSFVEFWRQLMKNLTLKWKDRCTHEYITHVHKFYKCALS